MATALTSTPDFVTIVTNIGVFLVAAGTVVISIWSAVKKIKTVMPSESPTTQKVIGGMIMENQTLLMWSESNRTVTDSNKGLTEQIGDLEREIRELRFAVMQLKDRIQ